MGGTVIIEGAFLLERNTARGEHTEAAEQLGTVAGDRMKIVAAREHDSVPHRHRQVIRHEAKTADMNKIGCGRRGTNEAQNRHNSGKGAPHLIHRFSLCEAPEAQRVPGMNRAFADAFSVVGTARCAVRAASSGATSAVVRPYCDIRSARCTR